jgi:hypothetical protein
MHLCLCSSPEQRPSRCGLEQPVSPVSTGDRHPTGDRNSPDFSTLSPVSPVSPVARAPDGFQNNSRSDTVGRNVDARLNFSESPGATGDTGDKNAAPKDGASPSLRRHRAAEDGGLAGRRLVAACQLSTRPAAALPPDAGGTRMARSAAAQLRALANRVRRVGLNGRLDPEAAFIERDELAHALRRLADGLERQADQKPAAVPASTSQAVVPRRFAAMLAAKASEIASLRALLAQAVRPRRRRPSACAAQLMLPLPEATNDR